MEINKFFGTFVADNRKKKDLSQEALANELGITRATLAKIETSETAPNIELMIKILNNFEMSFQDFEKILSEQTLESQVNKEIKNSDDRAKILKQIEEL